MDKPRKFVEPDSLLAEICNRIIDALEARVLAPANVKQIVERTCAGWYANLPTTGSEVHIVEVGTQANSDHEPEKGS